MDTKSLLNSFYNLHEYLINNAQKNYNLDILSFRQGNKIYIKKKNKGKFTQSAKRAGMGVQEYAARILANKDKYSSTLVKRANFAKNASKWNKR